MITINRAVELVLSMPEDDQFAKIDLFSHFVEYFGFKKDDFELETFAAKCGYPILKVEDNIYEL